MQPTTQRGTLYLIPAPLGDGDIAAVAPPQVSAIVASLDTFIVEHPRTARRYLKQTGTVAPLQALQLLTLDEHTPAAQLESLLQPLMAGKDVGLLSEAGCPAVADPGAELVRLAHARNIRVVPLVGPSSILLGLMASGMNGQSFTFLGYLPASKAERARKILEIERASRLQRQTQIFIETPYRNPHLLQDLLNLCARETRLCIASDITLATEEIRTQTIAAWKSSPPDLDKRPTVFLLDAS